MKTIQENSKTSEWRFIAGKENPADLCSRGVSAAALADPEGIWWKSAAWLSLPQSEWPSEQVDDSPEEMDAYRLEFKKEKTLSAPAVAERLEDEDDEAPEFEAGVEPPATEEQGKRLFDINEFDTLRRVVRITAIGLRTFQEIGRGYLAMRRNLAQPVQVPRQELTQAELHAAKMYQIRQLQMQHFPAEFARLTAKKPSNVLRSSRLAKFHPYWDPIDRVIKLRGRTGQSNSLLDCPDLPILPGAKKGDPEVFHLVKLLIREAHLELEHSGIVNTLCSLRKKVWIIHGRRIVARVLKKCCICNKAQRKPYEVPMASLPADRCTASRPFEVTGLDFAGHLYLKDGSKCWFLVFTCGMSRALHLELVLDMTAITVVQAIESFFLDFGVCSVIYSDNAKQFKKADKELAKRWAVIEVEILSYCSKKGVTWKFIVDLAPLWGGFWERMVQTVKRLLRKILGRAKLNFIAMQFVLKKVRTVINSRPITYEMDNHLEPRAICPNDLLLGRYPRMMPASAAYTDRVSASQRELVEMMNEREKVTREWTEAWIALYLQERAIHFSHRHKENVVKVGEVVLIQEDNKKRIDWQLGVITEVHPSPSDGIIRRVTLRTPTTTLQRPVQRLCATEVFAAEEELPAAEETNSSDGESDAEDVEEGVSEESAPAGSEEESEAVAEDESDDPDYKPTRNTRSIRRPAATAAPLPEVNNVEAIAPVVDDGEPPRFELDNGAPAAATPLPARRGRGRPPGGRIAQPRRGPVQGGSVNNVVWAPSGVTRSGRVVKTRRPKE